jgi:hypothetical protein
MGIETIPTRESDLKKARELADKEGVSRMQDIAYDEAPDRDAIIKLKEKLAKPDLIDSEKTKLEEDIKNLEISIQQTDAGADQKYLAKTKRQELQGLGDELPYYKEMALKEMKPDMAKKILETEDANEMKQIAESMIATEKSVAEDRRYTTKMSLHEWVNSKVFQIKDSRMAPVVQKGAPQDMLIEAAQTNLDRAIHALNNNESQKLHLEGLIKNEVADNKHLDFNAVRDNAPRLNKLKEGKAELEKDVEEAKLWLEKASKKDDETKKVKEIVAEIETNERGDDEISEKEAATKAGGKNKITATKEAETKTNNSDTKEAKIGKASKKELSGWLKILFETVGGLLFIGWAALFGALEKQVGKKKGK